MPPTFLTQIPAKIACINDYIPYAKKNLTPMTWEYIHSGSADDITFQRNACVYQDIYLNSRVLTDATQGTTETQLFGQTLACPLLLAPVAYQKLAHPDGEIATAMAAEAQNATCVLSTLSSTTMEDVAAASQGSLWFQLYFQEQQSATLELVRRAEASGYSALMVTVDAPINGLRNRIQRIGFQLPENICAANLQDLPPTIPKPLQASDSLIFQGMMSAAPTWKDISWLKENTKLPIILKGIMTPADAILAVKHGANAIVVSNHGGRTLDTLPCPIEVLPSIAKALNQEIPIILDSGIRRGSDIFKALAMGANAVMVGRPIMYALATAGALGVAHVLRLLKDELEVTMALCGCTSISDINEACLWKKP